MSTSAAAAAAAALEAEAEAYLSIDKGMSFGPFIFGILFDCIMCGIMLGQFVQWYTYTTNERLFVRLRVYHAVVVAGVTSIFAMAFMLYLFAFNYGTYSQFEETKWLSWYPFLNMLTTIPIQAIYAERAYQLNNRNKYLLAIISVLLLTTFAAGLGIKIAYGLLTSESQAGEIQVFVYLWLGSTMASDILITTFMALGLYRARTGWSKTDRLLKRLIILSVETQLPPTLVAIGFLIEYRIQADSFIGIFFEMVQPKVYVVGLLAVLNMRYSLRRDMEHDLANPSAVENTFALKSARVNVLVTEERYTETSPRATDMGKRIGTNRMYTQQVAHTNSTDNIDPFDESVHWSKAELAKSGV